MKIDIVAMSAELAADADLSDYDFWRAIKMVEDELYRIEREGRPIPMQMIYARHVLKTARSQRRSERFDKPGA